MERTSLPSILRQDSYQQLSQEAMTWYLEQWSQSHAVPTQEDQIALSEGTGLSLKIIEVWCEERKKQKALPITGRETPSSSLASQETPLPQQAPSTPGGQQTAIDLSSPPNEKQTPIDVEESCREENTNEKEMQVACMKYQDACTAMHDAQHRKSVFIKEHPMTNMKETTITEMQIEARTMTALNLEIDASMKAQESALQDMEAIESKRREVASVHGVQSNEIDLSNEEPKSLSYDYENQYGTPSPSLNSTGPITSSSLRTISQSMPAQETSPDSRQLIANHQLHVEACKEMHVIVERSTGVASREMGLLVAAQQEFPNTELARRSQALAIRIEQCREMQMTASRAMQDETRKIQRLSAIPFSSSPLADSREVQIAACRKTQWTASRAIQAATAEMQALETGSLASLKRIEAGGGGTALEEFPATATPITDSLATVSMVIDSLVTDSTSLTTSVPSVTANGPAVEELPAPGVAEDSPQLATSVETQDTVSAHDDTTAMEVEVEEPSYMKKRIPIEIDGPGEFFQEAIDLYIIGPENGIRPVITEITAVVPSIDTEVVYVLPKCRMHYASHQRTEELEKLKTKSLRQFLLAPARPVLNMDMIPSRSKKASKEERIEYVNALWPERIALSENDDIRNFYGYEIFLADDDRDEFEETPARTPTQSEYKFTRDSWVQCDSCQKWRRLPDHVDVEALPPAWFCGLNRWDPEHKSCQVDEESVIGSGGGVILDATMEACRRGNMKGFMKHMKSMDKAYSDMKNVEPVDETQRRVVQCLKCFKKRALLFGMDPQKIPHPFVCWMNKWDELHSSCYIPEENFDAIRAYTMPEEAVGPIPKQKKKKYKKREKASKRQRLAEEASDN